MSPTPTHTTDKTESDRPMDEEEISTQLQRIELKYSCFDWEVEGVPIWERIRFKVHRKIQRQLGSGQAHTDSGENIRELLDGLRMWMKNSVIKSPFFANSCEFLFLGHPRRKKQPDGLWWDIYCDPIHNEGVLDYLHIEPPYEVTHLSPAKTEHLRYLDSIVYTGTLAKKLPLHSPEITSSLLNQISKVESEFEQVFGVNVEIEPIVKSEMAERRATLPLYKHLLRRTDPAVAVVVVSYFRKSFIEACKIQDIPVVELQHGVIHKNHFGYSFPEGVTDSTFPDYLLTFGEFWNENATLPIPAKRVISTGYPFLQHKKERLADRKKKNQLLFISQGTIGEELSKLAVAAQEDGRIEQDIVYKLHPGEFSRWEQEYPWLSESGVQIVEDSPSLYELMAESSGQIGVNSTAIYEGLAFELETYIYTGAWADGLTHLAADETALEVESIDELAAALNDPNPTLPDKNKFFRKNPIKNMVANLMYIK